MRFIRLPLPRAEADTVHVSCPHPLKPRRSNQLQHFRQICLELYVEIRRQFAHMTLARFVRSSARGASELSRRGH